MFLVGKSVCSFSVKCANLAIANTATSDEFTQTIGAEIVFFENADHFIHQYEPERVADLMRGFVAELAERERD